MSSRLGTIQIFFHLWQKACFSVIVNALAKNGYDKLYG